MNLQKVEKVSILPPRPVDSNKGLYGSVLVLAGSRGMAGAAALSGAAALRSGAGLVRVATPAEVQPVVASFEPSYMTWPLPNDDEGRIDFERALPLIEKLAAESKVIACGPGLGQSEGLRRLLHFLITAAGKPLIIDADGLNNLVGQVELLASATHPIVLTPHPGEFARLTGSSIDQVQSDRVNHAAKLAQTSEHTTVLLKGTGTVVTDGNRYFINSTGNPGMATGGTGDVLTGVIAALMAQKLPSFEAAALGAFVHGLSGDIARDQHGEIGLIAGDLVDALPDAFVHLLPDPSAR
jgi:ADP-dependent NAD(P)H-hydrate dehydratase